MPGDEQIRAVAQAFAEALDHSDFERARALLATDCVYDVSGSTLAAGEKIVGPDAILESYRQSDRRAREVFDAVEYASAVDAVRGPTATIVFHDVLRKAGQEHRHHCRQHVTVNSSGHIEGIVQEDIPEQVAAVREFKRRVGIES